MPSLTGHQIGNDHGHVDGHDGEGTDDRQVSPIVLAQQVDQAFAGLISDARRDRKHR